MKKIRRVIHILKKLLINNKFDEDEIYYLNQKPEIDNTYKNLKDFKLAEKYYRFLSSRSKVKNKDKQTEFKLRKKMIFTI